MPKSNSENLTSDSKLSYSTNRFHHRQLMPHQTYFTRLSSLHTLQWLNSAVMGRNGVPLPVSGVPPHEIAVPPPKVVAPPPGDAVPSICDKLEFKFPEWRCATVHASNCIFGKIITIVATRGRF